MTSIKDPIRKSLEQRQDSEKFHTTKNWYQDKQVFIRLTSMVQIEGTSADERLKYVLGPGVIDYKGNGMGATFSELYDKRNDPNPGITQATIKNTGAFGSIRDATVDFTCWNMEQLNKLESYYMTPGTTLLLEWGWNKTITGESVNINLSVADIKYDYDVVPDIIKHTENTGGHYDAMQGVVYNFEWSLNKNGGFNCSVTFVSRADMFLAIDSRKKDQHLIDFKIDDKADNNRYVENLKGVIQTVANRIDNDSTSDWPTTYKIFKDHNLYAGVSAKSNMSPADGKSYETEIYDNTKKQLYVTWEYLEKYILTLALAYVQVPDDGDGKITIDELAESLVDNMSRYNNIVPVIDSSNLKLKYKSPAMSGDPFVCVIPTNTTTSILADKYKQLTLGAYSDGATLFTFPTEMECIKDNKLDLQKILVNLRFVYEVFLKTNTLYDLLSELLNGISNACGNLWEFVVGGDLNNPNLITIHETKLISEDVDNNILNPFMFKIYHIDSIVRDVKLSTDISNNMKGAMMHGTGNRQTYTGQFNSVDNKLDFQYNFFGKKVKNLAGNKLEPIKPQEDTHYLKNKLPSVQDPIQFFDTVIESFVKMMTNANSDSTVNTVNALTKFYSEYYINIDSTTQTTSGDMVEIEVAPVDRFVMIPLSLGITLDGIAGIIPGNLVDVDYKPDRFKENLYWVVTSLTHKITPHDWVTEIETGARPDMKKEAGVIKIPRNQISQLYTPATYTDPGNNIHQCTERSFMDNATRMQQENPELLRKIKSIRWKNWEKSPNAILEANKNVQQFFLTFYDTIYEPMIKYLYNGDFSKVIVTSGYRNPCLNIQAGGAKTSLHMTCMAFDIVPISMYDIQKIMSYYYEHYSSMKLYELFFEGKSSGAWIHIGYKGGQTSDKYAKVARIPDGAYYPMKKATIVENGTKITFTNNETLLLPKV